MNHFRLGWNNPRVTLHFVLASVLVRLLKVSANRTNERRAD